MKSNSCVSHDLSDKPARKTPEAGGSFRPTFNCAPFMKQFSSNSALVQKSKPTRLIKKGKKSQKQSERDTSNGYKDRSPGVFSGKTQASTIYASSENNVSNFLKLGSHISNSSGLRNSSTDKSCPKIEKMKSNPTIIDTKNKTLKTKSS